MSTVIAGLNVTCLVDALSNLELPAKDCFLTLFAKALGYAIIVASTILKLPQILLILRNNSIEGLSIPSFELECVGYTIALSYCWFKQVPFSAYGELVFLYIQAIILVVLLYSFSPRQGPIFWLKLGLYSAFAPILLSGNLSPQTFEMLYNGQTVLFTISRIPQIWSNFVSKHTGQLSFTSTFLSFAGCIARLFTSIQEKAPTSMVIGSCLGLMSHGTLVAQIVLYNLGKEQKKKQA